MNIAEAREYIARLDADAKYRSLPFAPGRTIRWRVFGEGDPLVLIHGGHGSWLHWIRNIEALANRHTVCVADLPGFGDSQELPHGSDGQVVVDTVIASMDSLLGGRRTIDLAGFSFGGSISARIAAQRGDVRRLALLGSAGSGTQQRPRAPLVRWRALEGAKQEAALRHNLFAHMLHDESKADALAFESYVKCTRATRYRSRGASRRLTLARILARYEAPVLFLWGEHDVTATPEQARAGLVDSEPNRVFKLLPGGGHWIQFELADVVNAELDQWFK